MNKVSPGEGTVLTGVCLFTPRGYLPWMGGAYLGHGIPPPPQEKQSEHLLRGGWYVSCVHAVGLSCIGTVFLQIKKYI